jgi:hypothetical protein
LSDTLVGRSVEGKWESRSKGVGLDFRHCDVTDAGGDVVGRLSVWRLQGDVAEAARKELLQCVGRPDVVVLACDMGRPAEAVAGLERWHAAAVEAGWGAAVLAVGCRADLLGDGPQEGLLRALREWSLAHGRCGLLLVSAARGWGCELLRRLARGLPAGQEPETDELETLWVPPGWDTAERIAAIPADSVMPAPAVVATSVRGRREGEAVEAENEQAFLLRHGKLLEALREEEAAHQPQEGAAKRPAQLEVLDAPGTPLAVAGVASDDAAGFMSPAVGGGFTTPVKTPFRPPPPGPAAPSAAALADGADHAGLEDFFNSLLTKDKSPHRAKPK